MFDRESVCVGGCERARARLSESEEEQWTSTMESSKEGARERVCVRESERESVCERESV